MTEALHIKSAEPSLEEKREANYKILEKIIDGVKNFKGTPQEALELAFKFTTYFGDAELMITDETFHIWRFPKELYGIDVTEAEWEDASMTDVDKYFTSAHNPATRGIAELALFNAGFGNYRDMKKFLRREGSTWGRPDTGSKILELIPLIPDEGSPLKPLPPAWTIHETSLDI